MIFIPSILCCEVDLISSMFICWEIISSSYYVACSYCSSPCIITLCQERGRIALHHLAPGGSANHTTSLMGLNGCCTCFSPTILKVAYRCKSLYQEWRSAAIWHMFSSNRRLDAWSEEQMGWHVLTSSFERVSFFFLLWDFSSIVRPTISFPSHTCVYICMHAAMFKISELLYACMMLFQLLLVV